MTEHAGHLARLDDTAQTRVLILVHRLILIVICSDDSCRASINQIIRELEGRALLLRVRTVHAAAEWSI